MQLTVPPTPADTIEQSIGDLPPATERVLRRHAKRPDWGLAIAVWRRDGRTGYQFEDGNLRALANDFTHLMTPVDRPRDVTAELRRELSTRAGLTLARREQRRQEKSKGGKLISLDDQVQLFLEDYPGGFQDPSWLADVRGVDGERALKRHRDPVIEKARSVLAHETLEPMLAAMAYGQLRESVFELLTKTNLVTKKQLEPLRVMDAFSERAFACGLVDWLHGDGNPELRLLRVLDSLRGPAGDPGWSLVTAFAALLDPENHIVVRATSLAEQAKWMAPGFALQRLPSARHYLRLLRMVRTVADELSQRDLAPRDLMDVTEFIAHTLRPAARKRISEKPPAPASQPSGDESSATEAA